MIRPLREFVAFDLETTGLDRETDEIVEIGAVKILDGKVAETMTCLLKAGKPLSPLVESLTGISVEMLAEAREPKVCLEEFLGFAGSLPLVAHNADFDATFLEQALRKTGLEPLRNPVFDSLLLARVAWPTMNNHRLENLVEKLAIPAQPAHRALPDAEQAAQLWLLAEEKLQSYSSRTLADLGRMLQAGPEHWRGFFSGDPSPASDRPSLENEKLPGASVPDGQGTTGAAEMAGSEAFFSSGQWERIFADRGRVFQHRSHQARMAGLVERALEESRFLALESDPGTGKSLACLLPAVRFSLSRRRPVFLAVPDKATAARIAAAEFPLLRAAFKDELKLESFKPASAYLSPRKYADALAQPETRLRDEERLSFLPLVTWRESTATGDIGENTGFNHERNKLLWSKLSADSHLSEPGSYAHAARENAGRAHLVLITHDMFFDDLALDFALLPACESMIFLEAEGLVESGQARLGRQIGFFRLKHTLQLLAFSKTESNGLLSELERLAGAGLLEDRARDIVLSMREQIFAPERELQKFFNRIGKHAQKRRKDGESKIRFQDKLVVEFNAGPEPVVAALNGLLQSLDALVESLGGEQTVEAAAGLRLDLPKISDSLRSFLSDLEHVAHPSGNGEVFWVEEFSNPHRASIRCAPLDVGAVLAEKFFPVMDSVVFTSSSLAVGDEFDFFCGRMGLGSAHQERLITAFVRAPDADGPAPLFLARFSPLLAGSDAAQTLAGILARSLRRVDRPAFVFFTGVGMLKQSRTWLQKALEPDRRPLLAQHVDGNRENLLRLFRQWKNACLLGTEIFLDRGEEGGSWPDLIIVTKLPFPSPSEPLIAAALETLRETGGNPLLDFLVPHAILRLKQELNKIPRSPGRAELVWILDPRLVTEKYAPLFLRGLNRRAVVCASEEELCARTLEALKLPAAWEAPLIHIQPQPRGDSGFLRIF